MWLCIHHPQTAKESKAFSMLFSMEDKFMVQLHLLKALCREKEAHLACHWIAGEKMQVWHVEIYRHHLWHPAHRSHALMTCYFTCCLAQARQGVAEMLGVPGQSKLCHFKQGVLHGGAVHARHWRAPECLLQGLFDLCICSIIADWP